MRRFCVFLACLVTLISAAGSTIFCSADDFQYPYGDYEYYSILAPGGWTYSPSNLHLVYDIKSEDSVESSGTDYITRIVEGTSYYIDTVTYNVELYSDITDFSFVFSLDDVFPYYNQNFFSYLDFFWSYNVYGSSAAVPNGVPWTTVSVDVMGYDDGEVSSANNMYLAQTAYFGEAANTSARHSVTYVFRSTIQLDQSSAYWDQNTGTVQVTVSLPYELNNISDLDIGLIAGSIGYNKQYPYNPYVPPEDKIDWDVVETGLDGLDFLDPGIIPSDFDLDLKIDFFHHFVDLSIYHVLLGPLLVTGCSLLIYYFIVRKG